MTLSEAWLAGLSFLPKLTCSNTGAEKGSRCSPSHRLDPCTCWSEVTLLTQQTQCLPTGRGTARAPLEDTSAEAYAVPMVSYLSGAIQFTRKLSEFSFRFRADATTIPFHGDAVDHHKTEADRSRQKVRSLGTCGSRFSHCPHGNNTLHP